MDQQGLPITSGFNFRELGGYQTTTGQTVKKRRLLRTGAWNALSQPALDFLQDYGVATVVDFRSLDESTPRPDRIPDGVTGVALPTFASMPGAKQQQVAANAVKDAANEPAAKVVAGFKDAPADLGFRRMLNVYQGLATSTTATNAYREFFALTAQIAQEKRAIAFHCSAGKDRTGVASFLLLTVLGVVPAQIESDYLLSAQYNAAHIAQRREQLLAAGAPENVLTIVADRMTVHPEYLHTYQAALREQWGGVGAYLEKGLGVTPAIAQQLRADLLLAE